MTKIEKIQKHEQELCRCCVAKTSIVKMLREFKGTGPDAKHPDAYVFYFAAMDAPDITFPDFDQAIGLLEEDGAINYNREEGEIWLTDKGNKYHSFTSVN